jgi:ribosomal protein S27AE
MDTKLLQELADFLNFEKHTLPNELVAERPFWVAVYLEDPTGRQARILKKELEQYLLPVVLENQLSWKEGYKLINNLIQRINQIELESGWAVEPIGYWWEDADADEIPQKAGNSITSVCHAAGIIPRNRKIGPIDTDQQAEQLLALLQKAKGRNIPIQIKARQDDPEKTDLWGLLPTDESGERPNFLLSGKKINLLGREWFFGKDLPAIPLDTVSVRRECYAIILEALQDGELSRFRKCPKCSRFFVAEHLNKKYCGKECMTAVDNARAKRDVKKRRDAENQKKEQQYHAAEEAKKKRHQGKQFENFCAFMKSAMKVNPLDEDLNRIKPVLKDLGKGDVQKGRKTVSKWEKTAKKESMETAWEQLSNFERNLF